MPSTSTRRTAGPVTIGADPELFILNYQDYSLVPATELDIPGTKENPEPMAGLPDGFNFHRDNVMLEFGIPPTSTANDFHSYISAARQHLNGWLASNIGPDFQIYDAAHMMLTEQQARVNGASEFGCEPDYDAYEAGAVRHTPDDVMGLNRTAGGHIHIGTKAGFNCPEFIVALFCDALIGTAKAPPNTVDDNSYMWYRKAGIYRPKSYGLEYRTPSNAWMSGSGITRQAANDALLIGKFCSRMSAKKIRAVVESTDWIAIRTAIHSAQSPQSTKAMRVAFRKRISAALGGTRT